VDGWEACVEVATDVVVVLLVVVEVVEAGDVA